MHMRDVYNPPPDNIRKQILGIPLRLVFELNYDHRRHKQGWRRVCESSTTYRYERKHSINSL